MQTVGDLPQTGTKAPSFSLTKTDLTELTLEELSGKTVVLNTFPSIGTQDCANSVRRFNTEVGNLDNTVVLCISACLQENAFLTIRPVSGI